VAQQRRLRPAAGGRVGAEGRRQAGVQGRVEHAGRRVAVGGGAVGEVRVGRHGRPPGSGSPQVRRPGPFRRRKIRKMGRPTPTEVRTTRLPGGGFPSGGRWRLPRVNQPPGGRGMSYFICTTCGTQYAETVKLPDSCAICQDDRQYVKLTGQQWTTLDALRLTHHNSIRYEEPGLVGIGIDPPFAIGQRALFVRTPKGNVLWDCIPLLDPALVEVITALGGISAVAISHPHYYASMVEWSRVFGGVPIYLHAADRAWVMRPDPAIVFWEG